MDGNFDIPAIHRKSLVYDPRNTDNIIILDYFNDIETKRKLNNYVIYQKLIENDLDAHREYPSATIPISFQMIYHTINMAWINIMYQMLFIDGAYSTFYGEYKGIIDNILFYDTIDVKESLVYRYFYTGESIFHIAGKVWLLEKFAETENILVNDRLTMLNKSFKHMMECYVNLEIVMNRPMSIIHMHDFEGVSLFVYLSSFLEDIRNNKIL